MIFQGKARHLVTEVMLHCAAINTGQFKGFLPIQIWSMVNRWHRDRGFTNGFGYHGFFMPGDGTFIAGRPLSMIGAGCLPFQGRNMNHGVIHLLLIEHTLIKPSKGVEQEEWLEGRSALDWYDQAQIDSARSFIATLPGIRKVSGHNDYAPRLCPGFKVKSDEWL